MRVTVTKPVDVEVKYVRMELPVRHGDEDMPADFPFRVGDGWYPLIDIDTGTIQEWPQGGVARPSHEGV